MPIYHPRLPALKAGNLTIEPIHNYYAKLANFLPPREREATVFKGLWPEEECDQAGYAGAAILSEGVNAGAGGRVFEAKGGGLLVRRMERNLPFPGRISGS